MLMRGFGRWCEYGAQLGRQLILRQTVVSMLKFVRLAVRLGRCIYLVVWMVAALWVLLALAQEARHAVHVIVGPVDEPWMPSRRVEKVTKTSKAAKEGSVWQGGPVPCLVCSLSWGAGRGADTRVGNSEKDLRSMESIPHGRRDMLLDGAPIAFTHQRSCRLRCYIQHGVFGDCLAATSTASSPSLGAHSSRPCQRPSTEPSVLAR
jgi:hypothetical protein